MSSTEATDSTEIPGIAAFAAFLAARSAEACQLILPAGLSPERLDRIQRAVSLTDTQYQAAVIAALAVAENLPELPELLAHKPADIPKGTVVAHGIAVGICNGVVAPNGAVRVVHSYRASHTVERVLLRAATTEEVATLLREMFQV